MDNSQPNTYPVGARVIIRDEEWRITGVAETARAGFKLKVKGVSDLVRGKDAFFYSLYENEIRILKPEATNLVEDTSPGFVRSKLYLESLIRTAPKTDPEKIEIAHKAAMDPLPYQFSPALQALSQPRARILIADAVGIGKTLEAGILTSELIARGRGRRILVLATKAMLSQFQQEFWNRFSIPLVRLDSEGIARVRNRLPANHNPFHYFDRSIISIDTLKQDSDYRVYLEKAHWDIIIIDEAHNVAVRSTKSQRARLAQLLARRSDTLILLSATPHDGRPESFASLLNILDPTAIANPSSYQLSDFAEKGLVIRRFKKDVASQVEKSFPEREIRTVKVPASPEEEAVFGFLENLSFSTLDHRERTGARLFSTTLTKAFFSSPAACRSVIRHRTARLRHEAEREGAASDIEKLEELDALVSKVTADRFSKLQKLASMMKGEGEDALGWTPRNTKDRLVVFTESVETLKFLEAELPKRAGIKANQVISLSGQLQDTEIAKRVNEFNSGESPARLLLCSDVASEGINLHHFSHRMIHFDIPWSLMTFQQRNGRIDRYGQTEQPQIRYIQTASETERIAGDVRVLEKLIEKDARVQENLSDPAEFAGTVEEQEDRTAAEMEGHLEKDAAAPFDPFGGLAGANAVFAKYFGAGFAAQGQTQNQEPLPASPRINPVLGNKEFAARKTAGSGLFATDMAFARTALSELSRGEPLGNDLLQFPDEHSILISAELPDLKTRLRSLPPEVLPANLEFDLTDDKKAIEAEMQRARAAGDEWPQRSLLWALHPVMLWLEDRFLSAFGRHGAPVLRLQGLRNGETWALFQGGYPNRRGYIPVHRWVAVQKKEGKLVKRTLEDLISELELHSALANSTSSGSAGSAAKAADSVPAQDSRFGGFVTEAIALAKEELVAARAEFNAGPKAKLEAQLAQLAALKARHLEVLDAKYAETGLEGSGLAAAAKARLDARRSVIEANFKDAARFIEETAQTEDKAYLQLAAIFAPADY